MVTDRLREAIVAGEFTFGEKIPEETLAETFGVSRAPVRDALNTLQFIGLVEIVPKRGSFVFNPTATDIAELCEFREMLEFKACTLSMRGSSKSLLNELHTVHGEMTPAYTAGNTGRYAQLDTEFHRAFFNHCGNSLVRDAYTLVEARLAAIRTALTSAQQERRDASYAEHGDIIDALSDADMERFNVLLKKHVNRTQLLAQRGLTNTDEPPNVAVKAP